MDTRTGIIHEMLECESVEDMAKRLNGKPSDFVPVQRLADGVCPKCKGTGRLRKGLFSSRWKPCACVLLP